MPIRTNRGRAAVYRRLWGWPMRSPNHLIAVLVVVAVVVLAVGIIVPQVTGSADQPDATNTAGGGTTSSSATSATVPRPQVPPESTATSDLPTRLPPPTASPTSASADPDALDVIDTWARHWVNHEPGITNEDWLEPMRPLTTEEFLTEMATVEPGNIDATEVTGPPVTKESFTSSLEATVPTDAGELAITVVDTPEGWRVAYYEPVG